MICEDCGETNAAGTEFCVFCGNYLGWKAQESTEGADDQTQQLPTAQSQPAAQSGSVSGSAGAVGAPAGSPPEGESASQPAAGAGAAGAGAGSTASRAGQATPTPDPPTKARTDPFAAAEQSVPQVAPGDNRPHYWDAGEPVADVETVALDPAPAAPTSRAPGGPVTATLPMLPTCPECGEPVPDGRRFCPKCGVQFILPGASAPVTKPTPKQHSWWGRLWDSEDRIARRAYARSLPPLYRWRRVIITLLVFALIGGGLTILGRSPKKMITGVYYDLKKITVPVPNVAASVTPPDASADLTKPEYLVDASEKPWLTSWTAATQGGQCGAAQTTPVIQLSFAPARIRGLDVRAGMLKKFPARDTQFRPQTIWVAYADKCQEVTLQDVERQPVAIDSKDPITSLRIGLVTAYPPAQPPTGPSVLGFTEITPKCRPESVKAKPITCSQT